MSVANFFGQSPQLPVNLTYDGGSNISNSAYQSYNGTITISANTSPVSVFTYTLPQTPNNGAFLFRYTIVAKGGPTGSTNNSMFQITDNLVVITNSVVASSLSAVNQFAFIGFVEGAVGQDLVVSGSNVQFQVHNSASGQTTEYIWTVEVYAINTTL